MMRDDITVIVPLFNKKATVCEAIRSIVIQSLPPNAILVIDDGSTDGGDALVEAMQEPSLTLIRQENAGPGAARNTGIQAANTRFVAFLDADDVWLPDHLETLQQLQTEMAGLRLYANRLAPWKARNAPVVVGAFKPHSITDYPREWLEGLILSTCAVMVERSAALAVGGFATTSRRGEDLAFWLKLACGNTLCENHTLAISNRIGAYYRQQASDLTASPASDPDAAMQLITERLARKTSIPDGRLTTLVDFRAKLALLHAAEWIRHGGRVKAKEFLRIAADTSRDTVLLRRLSLLAGPLWTVRSAVIALRRLFTRGKPAL